MTDSKGWADEDRVYTVIQNVTKNSKVVLSTLNGIEIAPGQTLDLRTCFRRSQVQDATHEIASLIRTGHLADAGEGAEQRQSAPVAGGMPTQAEMQQRQRQAKLREISDSTSMSALEDWMKDKDAEVAKAAKVRAEVLLGLRDDQGAPIPGAQESEEQAKPTELIRSPSQGEPVGAGAAPASQPPAGVVHRAE